MENYQGDLTDIFRGSGGGGGGGLAQSHDNNNIGLTSSNWEFPIPDPLLSSDSDANNLFGDPFCNMRDPLLHELNVATAAGSCYFPGTPPNSTHVLNATTTVDDETTSTLSGANSTNKILANHQKVFEDDQLNQSPCHIFSRIQISHNNPTDSPVVASSSPPPPPPPGSFKASNPMVSIDMIDTNSSKSCLIDNTSSLQISSPRNLGIKRRKSQAKKVVCIPAPAVANSRPSGEVVPSDLWAWRKYGQKPIKGSPYPRGYYRCSSSKGCSARKQVERSRTDPNMLVITYTSEHNHPWPTQRNALAGSTRSLPPKASNTSTSTASKTSSTPNNKTKEEQKESISNDTLSPDATLMPASTSVTPSSVKEEINEDFDHEKQIMEMDDNDAPNDQFHHHQNSYRPTLPPDSISNHTQSDQDFFADLGEIEADPLHLLFTQAGFSRDDHDQKLTKALDPFSLFDWPGDENNTNNISIGGKRTL